MRLAALLVSVFALPHESSAAFVAETFAATVTFGSVEFAPFVGAPLSGTVSYDSSAVANPGSTASTATYNTGSIDFSVPSQGFSFRATGGTITVVHMAGVQDSFSLTVPDGFGEVAIFQLMDHTGTAFTSDALPPALDLASFGPPPSNTMTYLSHHAFSGFNSTVTSIAPEPSSLILSGIAVAAATLSLAKRLTSGYRTTTTET